ncbi:hypothetical protein EDC44_1512 [Cricetibacter osteomyelitidis]|uniref:Uncharacterized protein n=1 Tax=Cricetibacter osteomyelitidis TaxID=1521931 RepID=A0A4R2SKT0_9PAST|nr:hypothetical protein [Cricetibacter osteomyelitidis]TCP88656.1 hypothetical protein EDC44_1512 [Cricetibacter osteomyelitidis]
MINKLGSLSIIIVLMLIVFSVGECKERIVYQYDLTEQGVSSQGGEGSLIANKGEKCKIKAVYYGEIGKGEYFFVFDNKVLFSGEYNEFVFSEGYIGDKYNEYILKSKEILDVNQKDTYDTFNELKEQIPINILKEFCG